MAARQALIPGGPYANMGSTGRESLIPGHQFVGEDVAAATTYPVRQGIQYPSGVVVHGAWAHKTIGLGGN